MSTLASPIAAINELRIHQLPSGKPVKVTKAIRYDGKTFILAENGIVYSSCVRDRGYYCLSEWGWATSMVRALTRLGVISRKDADTHLAAAKSADDWRHKRETAGYFVGEAKKLGITLTAKQKRLIRKIQK